MEQIKRIEINGKDYEIKGDSVFIRYSANADGAGFTEKWSEGKVFMGVASGTKAPTDKSGYTWMNVDGTYGFITNSLKNAVEPLNNLGLVERNGIVCQKYEE